MTVTRDTAWRHAGAVPYAIWKKRITDAGGVSDYAEYSVWLALGDDSALALEQLEAESSYASNFNKIPADWFNAWNLEANGKGLKFTSALAGALAWRARLYDPEYKGGVYARTQTISDLIYAYAPPKDPVTGVIWNDTEGYIRELVAGMNRNGFDVPVTTPSTPEEEIPMSRDPYDIIRPYVVNAPVTKQRDGQGFNYGTRNIVGLAEHETQGIMTGPQRQAFFSCPNGERCGNALVDYGIPRNEKKIYVFQDAFTTNRIPHASGGSAAAITQLARKASARMGNPFGGVNSFYAAVEIEKNRGQAMTADQIEMTARLLAYIWAMNEYPADDAMFPDSLGNEVKTSVNHSDLYTSTNCRINDDDRQKFEAMAVTILRDFYAGNAPGPAEPPKPIEEIIPGLDYSVAARLFGTAKGEDGVTYKFDKNGPVSKLWLAEGKATGEWPALSAVYSYESGERRYFVFDGGDTVIVVKGQAPRWLKDAA